MTNEREKEITTKGEHKLVVNTFLTGGDTKRIRDCYLKDADIDMEQIKNGNFVLPKIKGEIWSKIENIQIEAVIVSVNGIKENILEEFEKLPTEDYDEVMSQYVTPLFNEKKE